MTLSTEPSTTTHRDHHSVRRPPAALLAPRSDAAVATEILQQLLIDSLDLCSQLKQAHWTVRGPHVVAHTLLFDELAERLRGWSDDIAQRCMALTGRVRGTSRDVAMSSRLPDYPDDLDDGSEHIDALLERYRALGDLLGDAIARLDDTRVPADVLQRMQRGLELDVWKLDSHRE
jgi:starvation-inducible DNA-binding protein